MLNDKMRCGLASLTLLLAACCTQPAHAPANAQGAPSVMIGPDGIAGLDGQVPFTLAAIERAFPGFDVVALQVDGLPAFHVREPGSEAAVFVVSPDWTRGFAGAFTAILPVAGGSLAAPNPPCSARTCTVALQSGALRLRFSSDASDAVLEEIVYFPDKAP
jgi:hypothetical protein